MIHRVYGRGDLSTKGKIRYGGETLKQRGRLMIITFLVKKTVESFAYAQLACNRFSRMLSQQVTNSYTCIS